MQIQRVLLIQGHPDPAGTHFCHALAAAYAEGARQSGLDLREVNVAQLDFPLLRTQAEWKHGALPDVLAPAQVAIQWAQHIVLFFPLWMGDMPALLKGFIEQVARPGFAVDADAASPMAAKTLAGRSARVVVTMGMPALVYRYYFRAHSLKSLERNILGMMGIAPVHESLVGHVEAPDPKDRQRWLQKMRRLGAQGA